MGKAYEKVMDSRRELVEKIIALMEEGYHQNQPLWNRNMLRPHNPESKAVYRGGNRLRLMVAAQEAGYEDCRWMTYKQMQEAGYHLKKGQHGILCEKWIFPQQVKQENMDGDEEVAPQEQEPLRPKVSYFYVYNAEQIEGYPKESIPHMAPSELTSMADMLIKSSECPVYERMQDKAFYNRNHDYIYLPPRGYFKDIQAFFGTLIHEMGHSTGHESRLNRKFGAFGDPDYAREELRAELGSLFMESDMGIETGSEVLEDHSDYLKSWIGTLRDDPNELFRACADAEKISERLLSNYRKQLHIAEEMQYVANGYEPPKGYKEGSIVKSCDKLPGQSYDENPVDKKGIVPKHHSQSGMRL